MLRRGPTVASRGPSALRAQPSSASQSGTWHGTCEHSNLKTTRGPADGARPSTESTTACTTPSPTFARSHTPWAARPSSCTHWKGLFGGWNRTPDARPRRPELTTRQHTVAWYRAIQDLAGAWTCRHGRTHFDTRRDLDVNRLHTLAAERRDALSAFRWHPARPGPRSRFGQHAVSFPIVAS